MAIQNYKPLAYILTNNENNLETPPHILCTQQQEPNIVERAMSLIDDLISISNWIPSLTRITFNFFSGSMFHDFKQS
jgi:hypothetical protein